MDTQEQIRSLASSPLDYKIPEKLNSSFDTNLDDYHSAEEDHKIEEPDFHDVTWESKYPFPPPHQNDDKYMIEEEGLVLKKNYSNLEIVMGKAIGWQPKTIITSAGREHKLWNTFKSGSTKK